MWWLNSQQKGGTEGQVLAVRIVAPWMLAGQRGEHPEDRSQLGGL